MSQDVLDDQGLRELLILDETVDLEACRRVGMPYVRLMFGNRPRYRYLRTEIINWLASRQRNPVASSEVAVVEELEVY